MDCSGQSLKWVRTLIGESGKYATARQAYENLSYCHQHIHPPLGAVLWYDMEPYGDVGLYVGNYIALRIAQGGAYLTIYNNGDYLGWSNGIAEG